MINTQPTVHTHSTGDLPGLYLASDNAARKAQKHYVNITGLDIVLLVVAAAISVYTFPDTIAKTIVVYLRALLLIVSLFLTIMLQRKHPEREWYDTRWLAETILTEAWLYTTCTKPYTSNPQMIGQADEDFRANLEAYLTKHQAVASLLGGRFSDSSEISEKMRESRHLSVNERRDLYMECRLKDQLSWYGKKTIRNRTSEDRWFLVIILSQIVAVAYAILLIPATLSNQPLSNWNATGFFVAFASASLAWVQLKQFRRLAQSYGEVEQRLRLQASKGRSQMAEEQLSDFVTETEDIIKAEYTAWYARRSQE